VASTWEILGFKIEPDWLEAWGTWVGGIGTISAVLWAMYVVKREARRLEDDKREAQDLQANTVVLHDFDNGPPHAESHRPFLIQVGNYGLTPITRIKGWITHQPTGARARSTLPIQVLPANTSRSLEYRLPPDVPVWVDHPTSWSSFPFQLFVGWTDVHGNRWHLKYGEDQQPVRSRGITPRSKWRVTWHRVWTATSSLRASLRRSRA
jgi:hypothetical protein